MNDQSANGASNVRIGVDIGGTKMHAVALASDGSIRSQISVPTTRGPAGLLAGIRDSVTHLSRTNHILPAELESLGIGIPGQVDASTGLVRQAINLDVCEWPLADEVSAALGIRPTVDNDVNAAALGAHRLLDVTGSMALLNLGTGVAAGIVIDGELVRGSRGAAGEIGHFSIDANGPLCDCGQRGCIEALAGGAALSRRAEPGSPLPVRSLFDSADQGRPDAVAARQDFVRGVSAAIRVLLLSIDVGTVVIGGGITALGDRVSSPIRASLVEAETQSAFLRSADLSGRISFLPASLNAPAIGAAWLPNGDRH